MINATKTLSGKVRHDENFPVASWLIAPRYRSTIIAFYRFARAADDVADHATLSRREKFALLDSLEDTLLGGSDAEAEAMPLRAAMRETRLSPRHAIDLLVAFRWDVSRNRYQNWNELLEYCRYSAMPVGRFVLDLHGESASTWAASDALCAALQIINHLQDCGKDYRNLDRVYVPLDFLAEAGASVEALAADQASAALRQCLHKLALKTAGLLEEGAGLAPTIANFRLGLEVSVIQRLAERLHARLLRYDPLSQSVHFSKSQFAATAVLATLNGIFGRIWRHSVAPSRAGGGSL
jgi:hydroxysqualene synthase